ncbi:uncharacterized protein LACBIDRAFT_306614 [Laccaria bicolor S238N-H82]|uniref:Predicted protein n=1 Tax=Laccaria bicolor (strain S238N-H82 / ATCC MYA-4686) TaxID=486041 RepID=B0DNF4_LACBS|nr:uncharacterized protein LACBIDRAFT_306614 [Laccaria bicolor S238N-H82]EDR03862.1 predicted protein [Laccaria bicolor S238N-H82]|eukprot:XP_001885430.1 predicted protein [Laccaria bicolor S238N-H82]
MTSPGELPPPSLLTPPPLPITPSLLHHSLPLHSLTPSPILSLPLPFPLSLSLTPSHCTPLPLSLIAALPPPLSYCLAPLPHCL